jgi:hypothetical protein
LTVFATSCFPTGDPLPTPSEPSIIDEVYIIPYHGYVVQVMEVPDPSVPPPSWNFSIFIDTSPTVDCDHVESSIATIFAFRDVSEGGSVSPGTGLLGSDAPDDFICYAMPSSGGGSRIILGLDFSRSWTHRDKLFDLIIDESALRSLPDDAAPDTEFRFGIARNENDCGLTCPPEMLFIQHLDTEGRITLGETGVEFLRLARTPSNDFGLMMHMLAATDDAGNLFYAWENPINHLDTDWPVDQPIPWGWAYKVCVQKATPAEVNVWPDYPCVEVMRFQDVLFDMFDTPPIAGLVPDGEGGVIVVFTGVEAKLYAQRVSAEGELMWDASEHPYP